MKPNSGPFTNNLQYHLNCKKAIRTIHLKKKEKRGKSQLMCRLGKTPRVILLNSYVPDLNTSECVVRERISCYFHLCVHMQNVEKFSLVLYSSPLNKHSYTKIKPHFYSCDCLLSKQEILTQGLLSWILCVHASSDFYLGDFNNVQQKIHLFFFALWFVKYTKFCRSPLGSTRNEKHFVFPVGHVKLVLYWWLMIYRFNHRRRCFSVHNCFG